MIFMTIILALAVIVFALLFVRKHIQNMGVADESLLNEVYEKRQNILSLPLLEAEKEIEIIIAEAKVLKITGESSNSIPLDELASALRSFFHKCGGVEKISSEVRVAQSEIEVYPPNKTFLKIGSDIDGTFVLVRPYQEHIYLVDGTETDEEMSEPDFPSVYHWLLMRVPVV